MMRGAAWFGHVALPRRCAVADRPDRSPVVAPRAQARPDDAHFGRGKAICPTQAPMRIWVRWMSAPDRNAQAPGLLPVTCENRGRSTTRPCLYPPGRAT